MTTGAMRVVTTVLTAVAVGASTAGAAQRAVAQEPALTPADWREDLAVLGARLPILHPDPFHLLPETRFRAEIGALDAAADTASSADMVVGIGRIVAALGDGHTGARILLPWMRGFPLLIQVEGDGVRIRRIADEQRALLGTRIIEVEGQAAARVLERLTTVIPADNRMGTRAWMPFYFATREVLEGLDILDADPGLALVVEHRDGRRERITIAPRPLGEVETLLLRDTLAIARAGDRAPRPVRAKGSGNYWFRPLPEHRAMFVRIDRLVSVAQWPFETFVDSLFRSAERMDAERLILDLRSLGGGNHISLPLIHALVRSERFATRGRLFVLIGRGTFSAGQNLVTLLGVHLAPIWVGEPTAGRPNHYGVVGHFVLPHSGVEVRHARYFNQDSDPADYRHWQAPHLYAPPSVSAELQGRDPALETALGFDGHFGWAEALAHFESAFSSEGLDGASRVARDSAASLRSGGWAVEQKVVAMGYRLLRAGRVEDAVALFRLATWLFPDEWNAHDSLGDALREAGRPAEARAAYLRALKLNGYDDNARRRLRLMGL